ncbi:MAG: hypothetical protein KDB14_29375 [Planctomycetales bacterium]|nr:hypothetical protein [Planctomycetales bacterium]
MWLHPALTRLQSQLFRAQLLRMARRWRNPRRLALSLLAAVIALLWTAQTVVSVLWREPANPDDLRRWIAAGMLAYAYWHWLKAAWRPTDDPLEWSPAEVEWLMAKPVTRQQLLGYRLSTIASAGLLKAACFTLVMIPDIHRPIAAALAMLLGLVLIDLLRLCFDQFAWSLAPRARRQYASATIAVTVAGLIAIAARVGYSPQPPTGWLALGRDCWREAMALTDHWLIFGLSTPFRVAANTVLTTSWSWQTGANLLSLFAAATGLSCAVAQLDRLAREQRRQRERAVHARRRLEASSDAPALATTLTADTFHSPGEFESDGNAELALAPRQSAHATQQRVFAANLMGATAVAWTQWRGVRRFQGSLIVSFLVPALLSLLPAVMPIPGIPIGMQVGGSLAFYCYVLLPTALKFDYRRNIDRLLIFKALPISPFALTTGQLAIPVLSLTLFQLAVMLAAHWLFDVSWLAVAVTLLLLTPTNVLVLSIENLIFMLYPYRLNQEGVEIFLRSVLMFTGKGLMMALALGGVLAWSLTCQWVFGAADSAWRRPVFLGGLSSLILILATAAVWMLQRTYRRFDVSADLPAAA